MENVSYIASVVMFDMLRPFLFVFFFFRYFKDF